MPIRYIYITFLFLLFKGLCVYGQAKDNYSSSSVLSNGQWLKIAVVKEGIYRIDYNKLKQIGLTNPSEPKIYGNNQGQLSYYNNGNAPDDLTEIAFHKVAGTDGVLGEGDYILFYAEATGKWKFNNQNKSWSFSRHNYSDTAFYFITSSALEGKIVQQQQEPPDAPDYISDESDALFIYEEETENLIKSGREWFKPISSSSPLAINPGFREVVTSEKLKIRIRCASRSSVSTLFRLYEGTTLKKSVQVSNVNLYNYTGTYASITDSIMLSAPQSATPSFELRFFNNGDPGAKGWLDFIQIQARVRSRYEGTVTYLYDSKSANQGSITSFSVRSPSVMPLVWDITDPYEPEKVTAARSGENITFKASTDSLRRYILFETKDALTPVFKSGFIPSQNLHASPSADMIIVSHPLFTAHAEKLAALHYESDGLISMIVTPGQIYNEFSGGIPDIAAIRNFIRMKYLKQKGSGHDLKYLLLFGDGSYENKTLPPSNPNFIPTYQSLNSNVIVSSFTSDDFYGLLEDGEGEADGTEDIGIGRLPVKDTIEAGIVLRKIKKYMSPQNTGDWKNIIALAADDEDGNAHFYDAEGLSALITDSAPGFNIDKIYFDSFRQVTTASGESYPDATTAINNRINEGCLIFNYTGHGNESGLAHERVVKTEDVNSWKNGSKLPLFITATCEFSRFDDIDINIVNHTITPRTSAGEQVLLNSEGGAIALMSTTRVVYSAPNYFLNRNIYNYAFTRDTGGNLPTFGDIMRLAKNNSGSGLNKRNFSLLGDPALRLAYPWKGSVITDSINHQSISFGTDTLKALTKVTVSGHIEDQTGNLMNGFSGMVYPLVYDKPTGVRTLANNGGQSVTFDMMNNILFSGRTMAADGRFSFTFIVPRDINYAYGPGKISYYAANNTIDAAGWFDEFTVGGFAEINQSDTEGPLIQIFINDTLFRNGGITDTEPNLYAILEDPGGVNTTGSGIGHDLTAWIDSDRPGSFILNNYFINDFNSYTRGTVTYNLGNITPGSHTLTLKAWDNFNNSSSEVISFFVRGEEQLVLNRLINYPNPVIGETRITAGHNRPDSELKVKLLIFNGTGQLVKSLSTTTYTSGYQLEPILWNGCSDRGERVAAGVYPYRITITDESGESVTGSGRIIIL